MEVIQTQKMLYCPTAGKEIPEARCPKVCYICTKAVRDGEETYPWSG
jgi:hypothetical protein